MTFAWHTHTSRSVLSVLIQTLVWGVCKVLTLVLSRRGRFRTGRSGTSWGFRPNRSPWWGRRCRRADARYSECSAVHIRWESAEQTRWATGLTGKDQTGTCFMLEMKRVMYSTVTGSSTVSLWLWHSVRARSTMILASAVRPVQSFTYWSNGLVIRRSLVEAPSLPSYPCWTPERGPLTCTTIITVSRFC